MVSINANEFDKSIVYCGREEDKNNFLMELYLRNHDDKANMYSTFDYDTFNKVIDSSYADKEKFYNQKKIIGIKILIPMLKRV